MTKNTKEKRSLALTHPELAMQWHPVKNGSLTPEDITYGSSKKVWWYLPYDDPKTGKHFDFEWEASVGKRSGGRNCPFLSGQSVWKGYNDLASINPQLAKEWHPVKNEALTPEDVTFSSGKTVWWLYPYDDPITGEHFDFEWEATVSGRNANSGCPFLSSQAVWPGFNDLATKNPKLAAQWHPTKNGKLTPQDVAAGSGKRVWWLYPYDDPKTGKHFDFEWRERVAERNRRDLTCPFLNSHAIWPGYNDLETVNPELAKEWHPTKNGKLTPRDVMPSASNMIWWYLPYDDPITGKHFDFEWQSTINNRSKGYGCPYLANRIVWPGFNDLATHAPSLAKEWHPTKNGNLKPENIVPCSPKKVWWCLSYDDPKTGKHFDFEWQASVINRYTRGFGCPYLSSQALWRGFNDLATTHPDVAKEWHPTKNKKLKPTDVMAGSDKKVWWLCSFVHPITKKECTYEWPATINSRCLQNSGCPYITFPKTALLICDLLDKANIKYVCEKKFDDLKDINSLPCDFYISNNFIIEVDGKQHFEAVKRFGDKKDFAKRIKHDNIKNKYCYDNKIPLLRIPYIYDPINDKKEIEEIVLSFINTGIIPTKIINFYDKFKFSNYINNCSLCERLFFLAH